MTPSRVRRQDPSLPGPIIAAVASAIAIAGSPEPPTPTDARHNLVSQLLQDDGILAILETIGRDPAFRGTHTDATRAPDARDERERAELAPIASSPHEWAATLADGLLERAHRIERDAFTKQSRSGGPDPSALGKQTTNLARVILYNSLRLRALGLGFEDTIPDRSSAFLLRLLPYSFEADPYGGFALRYEVRWGLCEQLALTLPITPFWLLRSRDELPAVRHFARAGIGAQYRIGSWLVPSFELDLHYVFDYQHNFASATLARVPAELAVNLLAGRLRLSVLAGIESFGRKDPRYIDRVVFNAALSDLPGFLYWLTAP